MTWPLPQDYNEAVQNPRTSFDDTDLRNAEAVANAMGIPIPRSGNFADVYEFRSNNGGRWAVKCFTREILGLRERYAAISRHLQDANLPFMVDFTFLEQGIRIRGQWYPVLKMQWVEGLTLNEFVGKYADKPTRLEALLQIWVRMAARLRGAGIAHADLQHGNVLLAPGTFKALAVKLVDYDGMFVPALAGSKSGEVGHPCYQHPQRLTEGTYSAEVDRFPLLLVATALHAVKVGGRALWEKHNSGDNLLFREADLRAPVKSPLFYELIKLTDARASRLAIQTLDALKVRLEKVPLLEDVLPELHAAAVAKPATALAAAKRTSTKVFTAQTVLAEQPKAEGAAVGSAWDFEEVEKARSRRWRTSGLRRWVKGATAVVVAASIVVGGIFVWALRNETPTAEHRPKSLPQPSEKPNEQSDGKGKKIDGNQPPITPPQTPVELPADASVADLCQALKNGDPATREVAAARLSTLGPKAEPAMVDLADTLTNTKNPTKVRTLAALALAHIGSAAKPVVPALVKALHLSQPLEVRQYAAEALAQMRYPANEAAVPALLEAIEKDKDRLVRQKCVWAFFAMGKEAVLKSGADKGLAKLLDEKEASMNLVRYDAARKLANTLGADSPEMTLDVLLEMLNNKTLRVYNSTDVKVESTTNAVVPGKVNVKENTSGDARYMAVEAIGWIGAKAARKTEVVEALRAAATDKDPKLSTSAQKILKDLNLEIK